MENHVTDIALQTGSPEQLREHPLLLNFAPDLEQASNGYES